MAQEAVLRAWHHRDRCRRPDDPWAWLAAITRNEAGRRRCARAREALPLDACPEAAELDRGITEAPDRLAVWGAVGTLSRRDRAIVLLHYGADLPVARVAEELMLPVGTVKVTLGRIRSKLRVRLLP